MNHYIWPALLILISVVVGLIRILKGPTAADRMLAAQLFGTGGVAILLILAQAMQMPSLVASRHTGYISSHHDGRICPAPMGEP